MRNFTTQVRKASVFLDLANLAMPSKKKQMKNHMQEVVREARKNQVAHPPHFKDWLSFLDETTDLVRTVGRWFPVPGGKHTTQHLSPSVHFRWEVPKGSLQVAKNLLKTRAFFHQVEPNSQFGYVLNADELASLPGLPANLVEASVLTFPSCGEMSSPVLYTHEDAIYITRFQS